MKVHSLYSIASLAIGLATFMPSDVALAQVRDVTSFGKKTPSVEEIINAARPPKRDEFDAKLPRLSQPKKALDMELTFETNSAELTAKAREQLKNFGAALNAQELSASRILLEGHTDASGPDDYNKNLSEQRAKAVQDYLAAQNVDPSRFEVVGVGKDRLKDPARPTNRVNRRVEFVFN